MTDRQIGLGGLAVGIPGLVQTCLQLGKFAIEKWTAFKQAGNNTRYDFDLMLDYFDGLKTGLVLVEKLERILDAATRTRFDIILQSLRNLLFRAVEMLLKYQPQSAVPTAIGQRLAYVMFDAKTLSQLKADIASWDKRWVEKLNLLSLVNVTDRLDTIQRTLDSNPGFRIPSLRIAPSDTLASTITTSSKRKTVGSSNISFQTGSPTSTIVEVYRIPLSSGLDPPPSAVDGLKPESIEAGENGVPGRHESKLETISKALAKDIQTLATRLKSADPERMSILRCIGYREVLENNHIERSFELDFEVPTLLQACQPTTLRELLTAAENQEGVTHPLNDRLELANRLATAVWFVHAGAFVHKSISPENVLIFDRQVVDTDPVPHKFPFRIGWSFLAGFGSFRHVDTMSQKRGDEELSRNIYRHPRRWGNQPSSSFSLQDDIYSLGVVLWEVGLWTSLVGRSSNGTLKIQHKTLRTRAEAALTQTEPQLVEKAAQEVKTWLATWAQKYIPAAMGTEYAEVVLACLNGVEDVSRADGTATIGVKYMELIMERLQRIRL